MTDNQLLRRYVDHADQRAFAELVRLHVDVVYSAARRQARGDAALAEEITQQVFILLAQKARALTDEVLLGGWLYDAVRFVARDQLRKDQRRALHEQKAAAMAEEIRKAPSRREQSSWLMTKFDSSWPEAVVVSIDRKIMQKHLHPPVLDKYVNRALGLPEPRPATKPSRRR